MSGGGGAATAAGAGGDADALTRILRSLGIGGSSGTTVGSDAGESMLPGPNTSYAATTPQQAQSALQAVQGGGGASSKDLVSALQGAGKGASGLSQQQMRPNVSTPMASSSFNPGRGPDFSTLLQLIQQRNQYGMGSSGGSSGGLLGVR